MSTAFTIASPALAAGVGLTAAGPQVQSQLEPEWLWPEWMAMSRMTTGKMTSYASRCSQTSNLNLTTAAVVMKMMT